MMTQEIRFINRTYIHFSLNFENAYNLINVIIYMVNLRAYFAYRVNPPLDSGMFRFLSLDLCMLFGYVILSILHFILAFHSLPC